MRTINLNHWSNTLVRVKDIRIVMPDVIDENTKVVLLLHGYCGDHNDWGNLGGAIKLAEEYKMVFVMPSAENSYYQNIHNGDQFFDYISNEVVEITTRTFNLPDNWYVAGLSMGGYGALLIGLKNPKFKYIGAFSAPIDMKKWVRQANRDLFKILFKNGVTDDINILKLVENNLKPIYLYCGTEDQFYDMNVSFYKKLQKKNALVAFESDNRGHVWPLWHDAFRNYLKIISRL
jgi:S-formylglutathione hydrolase FrmB